jgi:hypothetical protein
MSLPMKKHKQRIMIAAASTALAVAGCSDSAKHDLAVCKLKAIEIYNLKVSSRGDEDSAAYYVQICMEAAGYQLKTGSCGDTTARWSLDSCYYPDTWWGRWRAG